MMGYATSLWANELLGLLELQVNFHSKNKQNKQTVKQLTNSLTCTFWGVRLSCYWILEIFWHPAQCRNSYSSHTSLCTACGTKRRAELMGTAPWPNETFIKVQRDSIMLWLEQSKIAFEGAELMVQVFVMLRQN